MKRRVAIALFIFSFIFISAWVVNDIYTNEDVEESNGQLQILTIEEKSADRKFGPREYIKTKR